MERGVGMGKIYLTVEQAESVLPGGDSIHTFFNPGFGLIGADWDRKDILEQLKRVNRIEICGKNAKKLGHGICAYNDGCAHDSVLFIETDMDRLEKLENQLTEG